MPTYKLTYFNTRGRAEVSRMLFALADQEFTDERIEKEDWPALKPKTPFGSLPLLQVDDVTLCQSHAIEKYLAKLFGYGGKTPLEEAQVDMVKGCLEDTIRAIFAAISGKEDAEKPEALKKFTEETLYQQMQMYEKMQNNNGGEYFVGKEMTVADLTFYVVVRHFEGMLGVTLDLSQTPKLEALVDRVEKSPKIAKWIATRP